MKCPECGTKITAKHYDASYRWYECPKCEGCFTADELEESENGTSPRKRRDEALKATKKIPVAKGKKRLSEIQDDEEAAAKHEKEMLKPVKADAPEQHKHRDEVATREVVNIMADEIQAYYEELGGKIDEMNAQDKALTIWRQVKIDTGISAREIEIIYATCKEHSS